MTKMAVALLLALAARWFAPPALPADPPPPAVEAPVVVPKPVPVHIPKPAPAPTAPEADTPPARRTVVDVAVGELDQTGRPYMDGGFWCARFVDWVYRELGWPALPSTLPLELWRDSPKIDRPQVGGLVFVDLFAGSQPGVPVSHVGLVVDVRDDGSFDTTEGNLKAATDRVVRLTRRVGDVDVAGFAPAP